MALAPFPGSTMRRLVEVLTVEGGIGIVDSSKPRSQWGAIPHRLVNDPELYINWGESQEGFDERRLEIFERMALEAPITANAVLFGHNIFFKEGGVIQPYNWMQIPGEVYRQEMRKRFGADFIKRDDYCATGLTDPLFLAEERNMPRLI